MFETSPGKKVCETPSQTIKAGHSGTLPVIPASQEAYKAAQA
jgi:hypothetical protein